MNRSVVGLLCCVLLVSGLVACGGDDVTPPPGVDAGDADAGPGDGGPRDAAPLDAGDVDAGGCPDLDGDGHGASPCGDDCDDGDATRFPGATEVCDGDDEDCMDTTYGADVDADRFESAACCNGTGNCGADCDDSDVNVNPDATEVCNGGLDEDSSATGVGGNQADNTASNSGAVYVY